MKRIILVILICCASFAGNGWADHVEFIQGLEKVSLQLKWKHQFQFAGYYAALEQGYYRDAGLDVEIRVRKIGPKRPVDLVLDGVATYGVEGSNLLVRRLQGDPLVALAAIFQHSPSVLLALQESRINTAKDIAGKRMMDYGVAEAGLPAMLMQEGIDLKSITHRPMSYNLESLINGETDLYSAYLTNEPYFLKQRNISYTVINPVNYGIDFYNDFLFTTEEELAEHPQRAKAFLEASLKGWEYALSHQEEIVELILSEYSQRKTREHLLFEARETAKLIRPDVVDVGHINPGRIAHMGEVLQRLGRVESADELNGFVYAENPVGQLTIKELVWLQQKHRVQVFVAHAPPLVFVKDGQVEGLLIDYLNRLTTDFGVQIEYTQPAWSEAVEGLVHKSGPDVLPIISPATEHRQEMVLSDPFLSMPSVIFTRDDSGFIGGLEDLAGLTVAMPKGFLLQSLFEKEDLRIETILTPSMQEALKLLATGQADAYIGNLMMTSHIIKEMGLENIKVAAPFPKLSPEHVLAVRSDWPELVSLFNRIIRKMAPREQAEMRQRWLSMRYEYGINREEIWIWAGSGLTVLLLGFGLFTVWTRSLQKEISRRKATEKALVDSVQQYQHLVQVLPHGIIEIDQNLLITYCNAPFAAILDEEPSKFLGKALVNLIVADGSFSELQQMLEVIRDGGEHLGLKLQLFDSQEEMHDVRFDLGFAGQAVSDLQIIIVTDLTLQEKTEKALQESEDIYHRTFDNIQAGVAHLAINGRVTRVNRFMCQMFGYSMDEFLKLDMFQITHPDDLQVSIEKLQHLRELGQGSYSLAKRYLKKNGSPIWALISVSVMEQPAGEDCYIVVVQDIDDLKHQQNEVVDAAKNLENTIEQRTSELLQRVTEVEQLNSAMLNLAEDLRLSNRQLELKSEEVKESNRELESFAYSVSHDLRAPLRHISGFASVLQEHRSEQLGDAARRLLEKIVVSAATMGKMIDDLLTFSRAGRAELVMAPVDMNLLFEEVRRAIDEDYQSPSIDWQIGTLPQVKGDVAALRQVVTNLLDNAAKYSSKEDRPRIEISGQRLSGEVVFSVRDNGVGFDPVYADKLYKVFQRLHHEDEFPGTGIGLASVRRIVMRHGGWIKEESKPGQGACFRFAFSDEAEGSS